MRLRTLSFHIAALPVLAQGIHFTAKEAIRAEWMRTPPALSAEEVAKLPPADRARYERTVQRIGRPGAPRLLPTELDHPTQGQWSQKAEEARTPRERFDALFFLNRFKDPGALKALEGLKPEDAKTWPRHLHLEAQIATARLNGADVSPQLQAFLDALQKEGKVDPVRAQAARLRLVMAGKEKELLPAVKDSPRAELALIDAWNRAPWETRKDQVHRFLGQYSDSCSEIMSLQDLQEYWSPIGIGVSQADYWPFHPGSFLHLMEGVESAPNGSIPWTYLDEADEFTDDTQSIHVRLAFLGHLQKFENQFAVEFSRGFIRAHESDYLSLGTLLPSLRVLGPTEADLLRAKLLASQSPIARAAAIEDLPAPPADLGALTKRTWADDQFESQQTLIQSYARWKMSPEDQKAQLRPWLQHPNWSCRFEAYQALLKLDPSTPWPEAPKPSATEEKILAEAERLAQRGKPVRLRITFSGHRQVTMRLDPTVAPINVANLELLAKKRFFDGHLVPRVVPDFVVQMGSPFDTMDGGPGYTVRCEDSLDWYGPGSVGMALAGKDTGGCQFFITTNATPHLTGKYTRVGEVEDLDKALKILDDLELGAKIESIQVMP